MIPFSVVIVRSEEVRPDRFQVLFENRFRTSPSRHSCTECTTDCAGIYTQSYEPALPVARSKP